MKNLAIGNADIPSARLQDSRQLPNDIPVAQSLAELDESAASRADSSGAANQVRSIALVFLIFDPTAAFKLGVPGMRVPSNKLAFTASRHVAQGQGNRFFGTPRLPVMRGSVGSEGSVSLETYEKLAADYLEEGWPGLTVEELLIELKAVANPDANLVQAIKDFESILAEVQAEQNALEKLYAEVAVPETLSTVEPSKGNSDPSLEKVGTNSVEKGCPLLTVEELLAQYGFAESHLGRLLQQLKLVKDPSAELVGTIQELELSLEESQIMQSDVEKFVKLLAGR